MTLANKITIIRILAIPLFLIAVIRGYDLWAVLLFTGILISDILDGTVARRRKERTPLGAFLDPLADKLLIITAMLMFTLMGKLSWWIFIVIFSKDFLVSLGWMLVFIITGSREVVPRPAGKTATALQMASAFCILVGVPQPYLSWLLLTMVAVTIAAALDYIAVGSARVS